MSFSKKCSLINFLMSVLFLIDRLTKWLAFQIPEDGFFVFSKSFVGLKLYKNLNSIFYFKIHPAILYFLIFFTLIILFWLLFKNYQKKNIFLIFALNLIIFGAVSNLIDRLIFGYVIDFLSFFDFSIFNFSDIYIVAGVGLIIIQELWHGSNNSYITKMV